MVTLLFSLLLSLTLSPSSYAGSERYEMQIGSEWGKKHYDPKLKNAAYQRLARSAISIGIGSGFYLGKFAGQHLVATNTHVMARFVTCDGNSNRALFGASKSEYYCSHVLFSRDDVDLAIFSIAVPESDEASLKDSSLKIAWNHELTKGEPLMTAGYGHADYYALTINADADCKVFSTTSKELRSRYPDGVTVKATWGFPTGCEISSGDSGSPLVLRKTGEVVGLMFAGAQKRDAQTQPKIIDSKKLDQLFRSDDPLIWSELTYAVPMSKIAEAIRQEIQKPEMNEADRASLTEFVVP